MKTNSNKQPVKDTSSPYIDDVRAFLEEDEETAAVVASEEKEEKSTAEEEEEAAETPEETWEAPIPDDLFSNREDEDEDEEDTKSEPFQGKISLHTDTAFIDDQLEAMSNLYQTTVKGFEYKITQEEKEEYLRCMLMDKPITMEVKTAGSNVGVTCRALSVYEIELATYAGMQYMKNAEDTYMAEMTWRSEVQKYRLAMQAMQIGRDKVDYLSYKPEPGKLQENARDLQQKANERFGTMNVIRWRLCVHALNVFEHKLTRLNELALMPDFLSPGD